MSPEKFNNNKRFRGSDTGMKKPSYLKYDDVFMSSKNKKPYMQEPHQDRYVSDDEIQYEDDVLDPEYDDEYEYADSDDRRGQQTKQTSREYFSHNGQNISDERMVKYKKRQLPPLQRYGSNNPREMYDEYKSHLSYWGDSDNGPDDQRRYNNSSRYPQRDGSFFKSIWQKFIVAFTSILSLVCLSWIAYNWGGNKGDSSEKQHVVGPVIVEPDQSVFKVLPDNPGGVNVPHQDKMVYGNMNDYNGRDNSNLAEDDLNSEEKLLPPQEKPAINNNFESRDNGVDEYSIVDDKTYYVKVATNKNKNVLINEINNITNKYANKIGDKSCSIKTVRDKEGNKKHAILIGPFDSKDSAIRTAKDLNTNCSVVAVRE